MLFNFAIYRLKLKYQKSVLGYLWILIQPIIYLGILFFVYNIFLSQKINELDNIEYSLYIFGGLIPYLCISDTINNASSTIQNFKNFIKNDIVSMNNILLSSGVMGLINFLVMTIFYIILGSIIFEFNNFNFLNFLYIIISMMLICLTLSVVLTIIFFVLPDLYQVVNLLLILGIFVSPIAYKYEMVPTSYQFMIFLNPVETYLEFYRSTFNMQNLSIDTYIFLKNLIINLVFFLISFFILKKSKRYIQDNV
tara:strand:+ start:1797 stop:2552 length:756 start_codon:yes stop_codon:yes gene_type:complete